MAWTGTVLIVETLNKDVSSQNDEVAGEWRKLHNEKLNDLYSSPNIIRVIKSRRLRWAGHVARVRGEERHIQGFGGQPEGNRPRGRPRSR